MRPGRLRRAGPKHVSDAAEQQRYASRTGSDCVNTADDVLPPSGPGLQKAFEALVSTLSELCTEPSAPATVLVTHHVEEIPKGITHALLLKQGSVLAAGPIDDVLTETNLSATFDLPLQVVHSDGRWSARGRA